VIAGLYGPALGRYFTSEDFLLLRFLGERPPWHDLVGTVAGPWLGVTIVKFYRPVATTLLALEGAWFGSHPLPYNLTHVAVHVANAFLVAALASRLQRRFLPRTREDWAPWLAGLAFAVYPLHPNAVLFVASFATVFGTFFLLAAAVLYCRHRETGGVWTLVASLGPFVLALGSYESTVVLVGLLLALEILAPGDRRGAAAALAPFAVLTAGYLGLRRAIFGTVVGGYDDVAMRLATPSLSTHADNLVTSVHRFVLPLFDAAPARPVSLAILGLLILAPAALALATHRRVVSGHLRLVLFAAAWTLASMAPFAFVPAVPATGRYWYAAAIGAGLGLAAWARWLCAAFPRLGVAVVAVALAATTGWAWLLSANIAVNREAARTARAIQRAVADTAATDGATRRYLAGYPLFVKNRAGVNMAQVYHYGLADALAPPFGSGARVHVYPLPPLTPAVFAPLTRLDGVRLYTWTPEQHIRPLSAPLVPGGFAVTGPPDGVDAGAVPSPAFVVVPSGRGQLLRLIVLAAGNWSVVEERAGPGPSTSLRFPGDFVRAMSRLYPRREILWWTVAQDAERRVLGVSDIRRLVASSEKIAVALGVVQPSANVLLGIPAKGDGHD
jgi:hypothetical protein